MAASEAGPPQENQPEQAFNFDAMNDDQVVMLGRFIIAGIDRKYDQERDVLDSEDVGKLYVGGMALLLAQDPDRAKAILKRQTLSDDAWDEMMAVRCLPTLAQYDFGLARNIFAYALNADDRFDVIIPAVYAAKRQIEVHASPEEVADLQAAKEVADAALPHRPVLPGLAN